MGSQITCRGEQNRFGWQMSVAAGCFSSYDSALPKEGYFVTATNQPSKTGSARERLQQTLLRLPHSGSRSAGRSRHEPGPASVAAAVPAAAPSTGDTGREDPCEGQALPVELLDLVDRLDTIADRLADLEHPGRPLPATRAIFAEWVRLRKWEEFPFSEFLTLRRAGRI